MSTATANPLLNLLRRHEACDNAIAWVRDGGYADLQTAWNACERADWMLWLYGRIGDRKRLVLAACAIADDVLPIYEAKYPDDKRPRVAIETARAWCRGEATIEEVRNAAAAADYAADYAAYAAAAAATPAANAARHAADAADYAAYAAAAAYAARHAADAAYAANAANAAADRKYVALIREIIPNPEAK